MKDLRVFLPVLLLTLIVLLITGCGGVVPSPGATEDVTTISGQIKMPLTCCDTLSSQSESLTRDEATCDESDLWPVTPGAIIELKSAEKGKCNKLLDTTIADESGYYAFEDVKPGLYIITAFCPVTGDEGFLIKDVAEKVYGEALEAGIPDCTSTGLALVIEMINDCYDEHYQCFDKYSAAYKLVKGIASDIGTVDIPAIMAHDDFGDYCDDKDDDLVDVICAWSCCVGPGATGGGGNNTPTPGPCDNNTLPTFDIVEYYDGDTWTEIASGDSITFFTGIEYKLSIEASDDGTLDPLTYKLFVDDVLVEEELYPDPGPLEFNGIPGVDDIGEISLNMVLADGCGQTTFGAFDIKICPSDPYLVVNVDDTSPCAGTCANVESIYWRTEDDTIATFEPPYEANGSDGLGLDWTTTGLINFDPETGDICWSANDVAATAKVVLQDTIQFTYNDDCGQAATHEAITLTINPLLESLEITHDPIEICVGETVNLCDYITEITATFEDDSTSDIACADLGFPIISNNLSFTSSSSITGETVGAGTIVAQYTGPCGETKRDTIEVEVIDCCGSCSSDIVYSLCYSAQSEVTYIYDEIDDSWRTKFEFTICKINDFCQDISHVVYGVNNDDGNGFCDDIDASDILNPSPAELYDGFGLDPSTDTYGVKWNWDVDDQTKGFCIDCIPDRECKVFSFELEGCRVLDYDETHDYKVIIKSGQCIPKVVLDGLCGISCPDLPLF